MERPLELELVGLSSRVEVLVVKLFDPSEAAGCAGLDPSLAAALEAERETTWQRASEAPRRLELEGLETGSVQVVAVGLAADGTALQLACEVFTHEELERPERTLELEMR